jgi:uncharacterized YccA/Bax inhibitor family protein
MIGEIAMALLKTSNPALNINSFSVGHTAYAEAMTLPGTVNETGILLACTMATAILSWSQFFRAPSPDTALPFVLIGGIGGFITALVTIFKKEWSPITAPIYALLEGLALGGISAMFELRRPGIAIQAVGLTFGTLIVLLLGYRSGVIKVTEKFRLGIVAATGGIAVFLSGSICPRVLRSPLRGHQWLRRGRNWIQHGGGDCCFIEPRTRF